MMYSVYCMYGYVVKDYSEKENPLPKLYQLPILISSKDIFISTIPQTGQYILQHLFHPIAGTRNSSERPTVNAHSFFINGYINVKKIFL